jgi:nucleoside-diphosphate-sugar epimerase
VRALPSAQNRSRFVHGRSVRWHCRSPIINGTAALPLVTLPHHGNHYGHTKALAEELLRRAADASSALQVVIVRSTGIFGPNDNTHFPRLKSLLRAGLFNLKVGDDASLVDWIFIDNISHALLCAAAADFQTVPSLNQGLHRGQQQQVCYRARERRRPQGDEPSVLRVR